MLLFIPQSIECQDRKDAKWLSYLATHPLRFQNPFTENPVTQWQYKLTLDLPLLYFFSHPLLLRGNLTLPVSAYL